jgi:phage terminase large subunit GpA-like protein
MGSPDKPEPWKAIEDVLMATYNFADGLGLTVSCACIDSGGHYTMQVYEFCKKHESRRWFAIKGQGGSGLPLILKLTRTKKENAALIILGVDEGKTAVINALKVQTPGPFYCHFPLDGDRGYDRAYFKGLISEHQVPRKHKGLVSMDWEKVSTEARNEPFDLRNYARAAMKLVVPVSDKGFLALEKRLHAVRIGDVSNPAPQQRKQRVMRSNLEGEI